VIGFLLGSVALAAAVAMLADGSLRLAARMGAEGAERAIAATVLAAAAAVLTALGLGLIGLGGSLPALLAAAAALWLAARRLPRPEGWRPRLTLASGAALGAGFAWLAWVAKHPALGVDPLTYHLSESLLWVQDGRVGAVRDILDDFPVGSYPVTNEVLVAWAMGLGRSFSPALLATPLAALLFAFSVFTALRRLGAGALAAGLAPAAVLLIPIAATQHIGPHTDLPALAWLAACAALVAADRAGLLPAALLAGALAVGTKTTMAPLGAIVLAYGLYRHRRVLPWRALALAGAAGVVVGGTWYIRNTIDHGWPLWPFAPGPTGDPAPPLLQAIDHSFLERAEFTLRDRTGIYFDVTGGALLVLAAGVLAWLLDRRKLVAGLSAAAAAAAFVWMNAPFTGRADNPLIDFSVTTVRYLFPAITAAAAALALTRSRPATAILALATVVSAHKTFDLPFPSAPSAGVVLAGALLGALATPVLRRLGGRAWLLVLVAFLAVAADDLPQRHARASNMASGPVLQWFAQQPGDEPVAFSFQILSVAAGDDLGRELRFIPRGEPCERVRERLGEGWVLGAKLDAPGVPDPLDCLDVRPAYEDAVWRAYRPG
jgi:hypothetical protein